MMIAPKHAGKTPPPSGSPGLFALSDPAQLENLFQAAAYIDTRIETIVARMSTASIADALTVTQEAFGAYRAVLADLTDQNAKWPGAKSVTAFESFLVKAA